MTRTVSRLYDSYGDAQRAVAALEAAGYSTSEVGMVSRYRDDNTLADTATGTATGATAGAVLGGGTWRTDEPRGERRRCSPLFGSRSAGR